MTTRETSKITYQVAEDTVRHVLKTSIRTARYYLGYAKRFGSVMAQVGDNVILIDHDPVDGYDMQWAKPPVSCERFAMVKLSHA